MVEMGEKERLRVLRLWWCDHTSVGGPWIGNGDSDLPNWWHMILKDGAIPQFFVADEDHEYVRINQGCRSKDSV